MDDFLGEMMAQLSGWNLFTGFVALYLGLIVGSFLNVVIYRWPLQRSIVLPGSACGACGVPLRIWNNIPVLSYLVQRGCCSFCGAPFSIRYMAIEALCGSFAVFLLWFQGGFGWAWLYLFTFFCIATAVFFTDLDHWIIPDELNLFGLIFGCLGGIWMANRGDMAILRDLFGGLMIGRFEGLQSALDYSVAGNLASSGLGALVGIAFFMFIQFMGLVVARQEAMGDGDVKYAAVLGAFLGWQQALAAFFLSFLLGAVVAIPLMLFSRGRGKDPIPFGTFMSVAAVVVALWGDWLWVKIGYFEWY